MGLFFLCLGCLVLLTAGHEEPRLGRFLQALTSSFENRHMETKRVFKECRNESQTCSYVKFDRCCGDLDCYYPEGVQKFDGVCVKYFKKNWNCNKDSQCEKGLQCDRHNLFRIEGTCQDTRAADRDCYWDSQCINDCSRKWYDPRAGKCN